MLSTNSSSSIQKRRQFHRRQQSLEVPILATPLPAHPRRHQQAHPGHRRGLSLDQNLSAHLSLSGFRPLHSQEQPQLAESPTVRILLDNTNTGLSTDRQHPTQATQQQSLAQPGYQAQDFQSHLQQQLNANYPPTMPIVAPQPAHPHQQHALQQLQHHLDWYQNNYGASSNTEPMAAGDMSQFVSQGPPPQMVLSVRPANHMAHHHTIGQVHSHTMPNTPQTGAQAWPSPPSSIIKHGRSQSFQLDVAPMPGSSSQTGPLGISSCFKPEDNMIHAGSFLHERSMSHDSSFNQRGVYASSTYSSSMLDPSSPSQHINACSMPTLFEESNLLAHSQLVHGRVNVPCMVPQAVTGAIQDFNDPDFMFNPEMGVSPQQQALNNLGPGIPASIVITGVPAHEIQQYIGELSDGDKKYPCLWEGCKKRFGRKENVRAHVQTHLGDRQFKCDLCEKTFVRQHDLKRHIAIHSDERPHACICGQSFARHDALTRHRQRGMCAGALPGFEKNPEDMPKRGRPKKERPNLEERNDKATKQRKLNKQKGLEVDRSNNQRPDVDISAYASSGYSASDRSFPMTPPDTSDAFDAEVFLDMTNGDLQFDSNTGSWRDTPPTSPVSGSPTKTVDSCAPTHQVFDFNGPIMSNQDISPEMLSNHSSPNETAGGAGLTFYDGSSPPNSDNIQDYASPIATMGSKYSFYVDPSSDGLDFFDQDFDVINAEHDVDAQDIFSPPGESHNSSDFDRSDGDYRFPDNNESRPFDGEDRQDLLRALKAEIDRDNVGYREGCEGMTVNAR